MARGQTRTGEGRVKNGKGTDMKNGRETDTNKGEGAQGVKNRRGGRGGMKIGSGRGGDEWEEGVGGGRNGGERQI